jgi:hypothetical protein
MRLQGLNPALVVITLVQLKTLVPAIQAGVPTGPVTFKWV